MDAPRTEPRWQIAENIRHDQLPGACERWEDRGYDIVAVLPAGIAGHAAFSSVLVRRRDG